MKGLCTILRLVDIKEILSIVNILVSTNLGSTWLKSAVFIWWKSASCENNLAMYVCTLSIYIFQGTGSWVTLLLWLVYSLNCYQFPSPTAIPHFYIFRFFCSLTLEPTFAESGEAWNTKAKPFTSKDTDIGACMQFQSPFYLMLLNLDGNRIRTRKGMQFCIEGLTINCRGNKVWGFWSWGHLVSD